MMHGTTNIMPWKVLSEPMEYISRASVWACRFKKETYR